MDVERLGIADIISAPNAVNELTAGEHAAGVAQQVLQHLPLAALLAVLAKALGVPRDSDYRPTGMPDPVLVPFELPEQTVDVVLSRADYTAVRSWSESAPPGLNANNVA